MKNLLSRIIFLNLFTLSLTGISLSSQASILVSNKPLALIAAATYPAEQIEILVPDGMSPHDYSLRPSDIAKIRQADKILWAGHHMEPFLAKFARQQDQKKWLNATQLMKEMQLYGSDPHVWLSPELAIAISERIATWHPSDIKSAQLAHQQFAKALNQQISTSQQALAPLKKTGFFVFHQAYDYWFEAIDIKQVGAFTLSPERKPGARRIQKMRTQLQNKEVSCVLSEPQFSPALINTVVAGLPIKQGELDPLAGSSVLTKTAYIDWLSDMSNSLVACLKPQLKPQY
jgi:zinc transport system substrate-binding protein